MNFHARKVAKPENRLPPKAARSSSTKDCAQCGYRIFMPEWSEWRDTGHAHHLWQCDACGYSFETEIYYAAA
jgi:hypothetical protein